MGSGPGGGTPGGGAAGTGGIGEGGEAKGVTTGGDSSSGESGGAGEGGGLSWGGATYGDESSSSGGSQGSGEGGPVTTPEPSPEENETEEIVEFPEGFDIDDEPAQTEPIVEPTTSVDVAEDNPVELPEGLDTEEEPNQVEPVAEPAAIEDEAPVQLPEGLDDEEEPAQIEPVEEPAPFVDEVRTEESNAEEKPVELPEGLDTEEEPNQVEPVVEPAATEDEAPVELPKGLGSPKEASELPEYIEVNEIPGHGHERHGPQVTDQQHIERLTTGIAPDGEYAPTNTSTNFHSEALELAAVNKGVTEFGKRDPIEGVIEVDSRGNAMLPKDFVTVQSDTEGGFGSGWTKSGGEIRETGNLTAAKVIMEYDPALGEFKPCTQFPTKE